MKVLLQCCEQEKWFARQSSVLLAVFELHGSQSMPGPLTYFHYPIGPMLLGTQGPHTYFSVIRLLSVS